jgi:hypothetical protein
MSWLDTLLIAVIMGITASLTWYGTTWWDRNYYERMAVANSCGFMSPQDGAFQWQGDSLGELSMTVKKGGLNGN